MCLMLEIDQFETILKTWDGAFYITTQEIVSIPSSSAPTLYTLQEKRSFLTGLEIMVVYEKNS